MKKNIGRKVNLGLLLFIGLVLFIIAIYYVGQKKMMFTPTFKINAVFNNVSGLQVGNNVRFAGINIGIVDYIEIESDTAVKVEMQINRGTIKFITKNSKAIIGTEGLMGNRVVNILPGVKGMPGVKNGDIIKSVNPVNFDYVLQELEKTVENATVITQDLSLITDNIQSGRGLVGKLIMDTAFAKEINQTVINLKQGSKGMKEDVEAAKHNFLLRGYFKKKKDDVKKNNNN